MEKRKSKIGQRFFLSESQRYILAGWYKVVGDYPLKMLRCQAVNRIGKSISSIPDQLMTEQFYNIMLKQGTIAEEE